MKNKFLKILGVGLTIAVLASMLVISAPASAANESFDMDLATAFPPAGLLAANTDVVDLAVAADGATGYAAISDNTVWKTTNGGKSWAKTAGWAATNIPSKIYVAPDAADFVAVIVPVAAGADKVFTSGNGGITFVEETSITNLAIADIRGFAISPVSGAGRTYAIAGDNDVWVSTPPMGATGGGGWVAKYSASSNVTKPAAALAVKFSSSFKNDFTLLAVTSNTTHTYMNMYTTLSDKWNAEYAYFQAASGGNLIVAAGNTAAEIALAGDYNAFDGLLRIAFVALNTSGLYRNATLLSATPNYSVAVNTAGDKLVAGAATGNTVYTLAAPKTAVGGLPTTMTPSMKSPAYNSATVPCTNVVVDFFGANIGAGTTGSESAFALSSSGAAFNDVAFIDTPKTVADWTVNSDATKFYMTTYNSATDVTSLWRKTTAWERVYKIAGTNHILTTALSNFDVVYLAQKNTQGYVYSNDAGEATWKLGFSQYPIDCFAVESVSNLYVLTAAGALSYATDTGVVWSPPSLTAVGANPSITLVSAGNVIIAGASGVSYSTDGGKTLLTPIIGGLTNVTKAVADKLTTGGVITAISGTAVKQYTIGTSVAFGTLNAATGTAAASGIVISGGVTYVMTGAELLRSPVSNIPFWGSIATTGKVGLKAAGGKLYTLDTATQSFFVFTEVLAAAGPEQVGPADKFLVQINVENGNADAVVFQWKAVAGSELLGVTYELQISLDSAFTQVIWKPTTKDTTHVAANAYQANTTYYWRVRVTAPVDSPWSKTRNFRIDALAPLKISSPASGAQGVSVLPTFVWSAVRDATEYQIIVSDRENFDIITFSHNTAQPVYAVTEDEQLAYNTVYYWRVRASKPDAVVTSYVTGIFTTEQKAVPTKDPITITQPGPTTITVSVPPPQEVIPAYLLWIIIGIGAILVIALIVLIVRTRRTS